MPLRSPVQCSCFRRSTIEGSIFATASVCGVLAWVATGGAVLACEACSVLVLQAVAVMKNTDRDKASRCLGGRSKRLIVTTHHAEFTLPCTAFGLNYPLAKLTGLQHFHD